jgi:hypothetical protein
MLTRKGPRYGKIAAQFLNNVKVSHRAKIITRVRQTTRVKNMINSTVCSESFMSDYAARTALPVH